MVCVILSGCIEPLENESAEKGIGIGLLLPYTGGDSAVGTNYERAAIMAKERINAAGGILGTRIHFVARDTHSDPARAKVALEEILAYSNVVAVIGPEGAEVADEILPVLQQRNILFISPVVSGTDTVLTTSDTPWFRLAASASTLGRAFANSLIYTQGISSVHTVYSTDAYNGDFIREFERRFVEQGGTVEQSISLSDAKLSYGSEVNTIGSGTTNHVVLAASIDSGARFVNELSITGGERKWKWYLSPSLQSPAFLQNTLQSALEGAKGIGVRVDNPDQRFVSEYTKRWDDAPLDGAFFYFDAVTILGLAVASTVFNSEGILSYSGIRDAMVEVATPSGVQVRWPEVAEGMARIQDGSSLYYSGLTGALLFTETGLQRKASMTLWSISNGVINTGGQL